MIHYHGGPITPGSAALEAWTGGHAMISFAEPRQIELAAEVTQSFTLDNGAFSAWKIGKQMDWDAYYDWVREWHRHPGFDWAIIPDIIDGDESANNAMLDAWPEDLAWHGVPVWHLHESLDRLSMLVSDFPLVCLGSSGEYAMPGAPAWWVRMKEAMEVACDGDGRPKAKLHGLRMLNPTIFSHLPLSSADSTNVARNIGIDQAWKGTYPPKSKEVRAMIIRRRIEHHASAAKWNAESAGVVENGELFG